MANTSAVDDNARRIQNLAEKAPMANKKHQVEYQIHRSVRTPYSEAFTLFLDEGRELPTRVGSFDLHITRNVYYGTLVLERRLSEKRLGRLIAQLEEQLIESAELRDDFILSVYQGKEIGYYSDVVTEEQRRYDPPTKGDLEDISTTLARVLGRHQDARGKLNEHALCDYFRTLGYQAERAETELDHKKIDVVAKKDTEIIYAQAKLGSVGQADMREVLKSVSELPDEAGKTKVVAIAGTLFPINCDILRRQLETQFKTPLLCVQQYQVLQGAPEYRRPLAGVKSQAEQKAAADTRKNVRR